MKKKMTTCLLYGIGEIILVEVEILNAVPIDDIYKCEFDE